MLFVCKMSAICMQFVRSLLTKCLRKLGLQTDSQRIDALFFSPNPKICAAFSPNPNLLGGCLIILERVSFLEWYNKKS